MPYSPPLSDAQRRAVEEFRKRHRTAVLALLFTDVEGSTALKNEMGELPASALLSRHNELIRAALHEFHDAQEISTAGDSFFLVFAKPSDAVRFALRAQTRLRDLAAEVRPDFRVKMGIHLGEVVIEEESEGGPARDVLGMQVDLASRVTALGTGGQILTTRGVFDNARQILKGQLLSRIGELSWLSHGPYLLKGFDEPLAICEVGETGHAPLAQPADSDVGKRATVPGTEPVLGWRPAIEQAVPGTQWVLEERLGAGGFGEVWRARHRRTRALRAFKFCFRADRLRSLKREMTLFRLLREVLGERQDIARLYDVQFEQAPYYLELEYTPGGNLRDWIEARGGFDNVPMELRLEIVAQIATALAAAHSVGVIHKDVKPSNVLVEEMQGATGLWVVGPRGRGPLRPTRRPEPAPIGPDSSRAQRPLDLQVCLTDFGIGQLQDRQALERAGITATGLTETLGGLTELSSRPGTRLYMAPELLAGREPSAQSDIYSLGVLLYQLIIGDLEQPLTTDWNRNVSDPLLREDLRRCFAGNPGERFDDATELARRLRGLDERHVALAEREAAARAATRRRRLAVTAAAVAGAVLLLLVMAVGLSRFRDGRSAASEPEQEFYYESIANARKAIEEHRYDNALEHLAACPKHLRHWEWGRLQHLCRLDLLTLRGNAGDVWSAALSEDGRYAMAASADRTATIWDADSGRLLHALVGHTAALGMVAFSRDGTRVVTASQDGTARVWNTKTGAGISTLGGHREVVTFAWFRDDGHRVVTGSRDRTAKVWNADTGREIQTLEPHDGTVNLAVFSRDGRYILTLDTKPTPRVWDAERGTLLHRLEGHTELVWFATFSSDSLRIATASQDGTAKIWDVERGHEICTLQGHQREVVFVVFSPDGRRVATASGDQTAKIWEAGTGECLRSLEGHNAGVSVCMFSWDGRRLMTTSWDRTAKIWDVATGREICTLRGHWHGVLSPHWFPDNRRVLTATRDTVKIWDLEMAPQWRSFEPGTTAILSLAYSPDGRRILFASGDGSATIWDVEIGRALLSVGGPSEKITSAKFSPDGDRIATALENGTVKIWKVETGEELPAIEDPQSRFCSVAFGPDGRRLLAGSDGNVASIRDADTGKELLSFKGHQGAVRDVVFSSDGRWVVTRSDDGTAKVWNARNGSERCTLEGPTEGICSIAISPDNSCVATAGRDGMTWICDSGKGRKRFPLPETELQGEASLSVVFSPDGRRVVTSCGRWATLWDADTGRKLLELRLPPSGSDTHFDHAVFSPDGRKVATAGSAGRIMIWETLPWRDKDLPGDSRMSYDERVQRYRLQQWKERRKRRAEE